jgi:hypothetical protein
MEGEQGSDRSLTDAATRQPGRRALVARPLRERDKRVSGCSERQGLRQSDRLR